MLALHVQTVTCVIPLLLTLASDFPSRHKVQNDLNSKICLKSIDCSRNKLCSVACGTSCSSDSGLENLQRSVRRDHKENKINVCSSFLDLYHTELNSFPSYFMSLDEIPQPAYESGKADFDMELAKTPRDVLTGWIGSNVTRRTGITVKNTLHTMVYDRSHNTLFWSTWDGIFKQVVTEGKLPVRLTKRAAYSIACYQDQLFMFFANGEWINRRKVSLHGRIKKWHKTGPLDFEYITISKPLICWKKAKKAICLDLKTKRKWRIIKMLNDDGTFAVFSFLTKIMFAETHKDMVHIKVFSKNTRESLCHNKAKIIRDVEILLSDSRLFYTSTLDRMEALEVDTDCNIGGQTSIAHFPSTFSDTPVIFCLFW